MVDLEYVCNEVRKSVAEVAVFIRESRITFDSTRIEKKAKNDLVSYVDVESERMLVAALAGILPVAGFITEENTKNERKELNWIIDPLDGTTNFIHGIPAYCISVALARDRQIILAVVHEVVHSETFYTIAGGKSYLNGKPIHVSSNPEIKESLIATGFPVNDFEHMEAYKSAIEYFIRNTHGIRRIGTAAADLCYVACGRFDGFFELNLKPWDVAAGALIVKNAGGTVTDFSGSDDWLFGRSIIASSDKIHESFFEIVSTSFAIG